VNFARIKERVRNNSGWSGVDDLSVARLEESINYVYTRKIPHILDWKGLQTWAYIDLAPGDGDFSFNHDLFDAPGGSVIGARVRSLVPPAILLINNDSTSILNFTYDFDGFWEEYPPYTNEDLDRPEHVLVKGRNLWTRPIPDDSYTIQIWANIRPAELANDTDETVEPWEEAIIAGATAMLLEDDEEEDAGYWWQLFSDRVGTEIENDQSYPPGRIKENW
jgi:hypothetical protein